MYVITLSLLLTFCTLSEAYISSAFYADNGLQQTYPIGRMSRKTRREVKHEIMELLGLHHRPKPSRSSKYQSGSQFLLDIYNNLEETTLTSSKHLVDAFNATKSTIDNIEESDVIMSFTNKVPRKVSNADRRFFFDLNEVPLEQRLVSAELRLYKIANNRCCGPFWLSVYKLKPGQDYEDRHVREIYRISLDQTYQGWLEINITETAQLWSVFPSENLGLIISISDWYGRYLSPSDIGLITRSDTDDHQPFMLAFYKIQEGMRRSRRSLSKKTWNDDAYYADRPQWTWGRMAYHKNDHQVCQMRLLYVNFKDLNWQDWIIAPEGYWAYFCFGECSFPLNSHMNATNHAIIQTLVHSMKPVLVPKPCCAPTKLAAISVLYFDNNSDVILKKYRNMVVKSCGCL